jgi:hypothetical protein
MVIAVVVLEQTGYFLVIGFIGLVGMLFLLFTTGQVIWETVLGFLRKASRNLKDD